MEVDVLVVGGGPGGALASNLLAKKGYKVLLVEAKKNIGKPVICGEYLPEIREVEDAFNNYGRSTLRKAYSYFKNLDLTNKTEKITVRVGGVVKTFNFRGFIIAKDRFISRLVEEAENHGARVEAGAMYIGGRIVSGEHYSKIRCGNRVLEVRSKAVIGADKYPSTVAKTYNLGGVLDERDLAYTVSQKFTNVDWWEGEVYMEFGEDVAPGGYAWIIPRGGGTYNVGLGVLAPYSKKLLGYYREFLKREQFKTSKPKDRVYGKTLPVGGLFDKLANSKVYLVGDAAGAVMPTNGGGIFTAMMCSIILCEELEKTGSFNKLLEERYVDRTSKEIGETLNYGLELRRSVEKLVEKNMFKKIFAIAPPSTVRDVIAGKKNLKTRMLKIITSTL